MFLLQLSRLLIYLIKGWFQSLSCTLVYSLNIMQAILWEYPSNYSIFMVAKLGMLITKTDYLFTAGGDLFLAVVIRVTFEELLIVARFCRLHWAVTEVSPDCTTVENLFDRRSLRRCEWLEDHCLTWSLSKRLLIYIAPSNYLINIDLGIISARKPNMYVVTVIYFAFLQFAPISREIGIQVWWLLKIVLFTFADC